MFPESVQILLLAEGEGQLAQMKLSSIRVLPCCGMVTMELRGRKSVRTARLNRRFRHRRSTGRRFLRLLY